jgi:hypothetical protein
MDLIILGLTKHLHYERGLHLLMNDAVFEALCGSMLNHHHNGDEKFVDVRRAGQAPS